MNRITIILLILILFILYNVYYKSKIERTLTGLLDGENKIENYHAGRWLSRYWRDYPLYWNYPTRYYPYHYDYPYIRYYTYDYPYVRYY